VGAHFQRPSLIAERIAHRIPVLCNAKHHHARFEKILDEDATKSQRAYGGFGLRGYNFLGQCLHYEVYTLEGKSSPWHLGPSPQYTPFPAHLPRYRIKYKIRQQYSKKEISFMMLLATCPARLFSSSFSSLQVKQQVSLDATPSKCMPPPQERYWSLYDLDL